MRTLLCGNKACTVERGARWYVSGMCVLPRKDIVWIVSTTARLCGNKFPWEYRGTAGYFIPFRIDPRVTAVFCCRGGARGQFPRRSYDTHAGSPADCPADACKRDDEPMNILWRVTFTFSQAVTSSDSRTYLERDSWTTSRLTLQPLAWHRATPAAETSKGIRRTRILLHSFEFEWNVIRLLSILLVDWISFASLRETIWPRMPGLDNDWDRGEAEEGNSQWPGNAIRTFTEILEIRNIA